MVDKLFVLFLFLLMSSCTDDVKDNLSSVPREMLSNKKVNPSNKDSVLLLIDTKLKVRSDYTLKVYLGEGMLTYSGPYNDSVYLRLPEGYKEATEYANIRILFDDNESSNVYLNHYDSWVFFNDTSDHISTSLSN